MSKELNIIQAMGMPVGTKFNFDTEAISIMNSAEFIEVLEGEDEVNILCWDGRRDSQVRVTSNTAEMKLTPIQQPVSFMEVVESGKKCRVEYELVKDILLDTDYDDADYYIGNAFEMIKNSSYLMLEDILLVIARFSGANEIQDIIKNGKWYIESEDN